MPAHPWYQFSLRSLLLLIVFVALLCALGIKTHWLVATVIGLTVLCGGMAGRIVEGTRLGFVQGIVFAVQYVLAACLFLLFPLGFLLDQWSGWLVCVVTAVVALIAGIIGGFTVRRK